MKNKILYCLTIMCMCVFIFSSSKCAFALYEINSDKIFQTDKVDVKVSVNTKDENKYLAGDKIAYNPIIENLGAECYVRIKIDNSDKFMKLNEMDFNENWYLNETDKYFYYKNVLKENETIEFCKYIKIPETYPIQNNKIDIKLYVEAIQSNNFKPNFDIDSPWGKVEIKEYKDNNVNIYEPIKDNKGAIENYNLDTELNINLDSFFNNIPKLLPSMQYKDTLIVENLGNQNKNLYFKSIKKEDISNNLLEKINLKVVYDNETIIDNKLSEIEDYIKLVEINEKEKLNIDFIISLDEDIDNDFANISNVVTLCFATDEEEIKEINEEKLEEIKTSDNANLKLYAISGIISFIVTLALLHLIKRDRREK